MDRPNLTHGTVVSVSRSPVHGFSKDSVDSIRILAGLGVEGDVHAGVTVRHRYHVRKNPHAPNLCQVHLLQAELLDELRASGFEIAPGQIGENLTVRGVGLLDLPVGAIVRLGTEAVVEITGLRDPCVQLNRLQPGLMKACMARDFSGALVRKAGVMSIAKATGEVRSGDAVVVELPPGPWRRMGPV